MTGNAAIRITKFGAGLNFTLGITKMTTGLVCQSPALIADAIHSFVDIATDAVTHFSYTKAREQSDTDHPYTHGKYEALGTLAIGSSLILTSLGTAFYSIESLNALLTLPLPLERIEPFSGSVAGAVAALSILSKEAMFHATHKIGLQVNSTVITANAYHHRADAISSVFAFGGISASLLSGVPFFDPIGGLLVSGLIFKQGADVFIKPLDSLLDSVLLPTHPLVQKIHELADSFDDIEVGAIRLRSSGPYILADIDVSLKSETISASAAHQIGELIKREILLSKHTVHEIGYVNIHLNPLQRQELELEKAKAKAKAKANDVELLRSPHFYKSTILGDLEKEGIRIDEFDLNYTANKTIEVTLTLPMTSKMKSNVQSVHKIIKESHKSVVSRVVTKVVVSPQEN